MADLEAKIEALLFFYGEPVSKAKLTKVLDMSEDKVSEAIVNLKESLKERGIVLLTKDNEVTLGTNPKFGSLVEKVVKEELHKDLGRAGLETLSIILYFGPVQRSRVDYIRGVSSTFIVRNLLIRGLIERIDNPSDKRSFLYRPTFELLSYLGVRSIEELPEYEVVRAEIEAREKAAQKAESGEDEPNA